MDIVNLYLAQEKESILNTLSLHCGVESFINILIFYILSDCFRLTLLGVMVVLQQDLLAVFEFGRGYTTDFFPSITYIFTWGTVTDLIITNINVFTSALPVD